eukprot:45640-Pyramimonas_sp.AAC.1
MIGFPTAHSVQALWRMYMLLFGGPLDPIPVTGLSTLVSFAMPLGPIAVPRGRHRARWPAVVRLLPATLVIVW